MRDLQIATVAARGPLHLTPHTADGLVVVPALVLPFVSPAFAQCNARNVPCYYLGNKALPAGDEARGQPPPDTSSASAAACTAWQTDCLTPRHRPHHSAQLNRPPYPPVRAVPVAHRRFR